MALTDAEKEANKLERRLRDRTHGARYKALQAAEEAAEAAVKAATAGELRLVDADQNKAEDDRKAALSEIDDQIRVLNERRSAVREQHDGIVSTARGRQREAYDRHRRALDEAKRTAGLEFPDLAGGSRYSAAAWGDTDAGKALIEEAREAHQADAGPAGPRR